MPTWCFKLAVWLLQHSKLSFDNMPLPENNLPSQSKFRQWLKSGASTLGKYGLSSLTATAVDFFVFHLALSWLLIAAVPATVLGRSAGACVAFALQRKWVFRQRDAARRWFLVVKYSIGVLLGMGYNVGAVWFLHDWLGWGPWPARVSAAVSGWFLIYLFNHLFVFKNPPPRHWAIRQK